MLLQLAHIHMSGLGVEANCSKAAGFVRVVLQERSGWSEDVADAVAALDEGGPDALPLRLSREVQGCWMSCSMALYESPAEARGGGFAGRRRACPALVV